MLPIQPRLIGIKSQVTHINQVRHMGSTSASSIESSSTSARSMERDTPASSAAGHDGRPLHRRRRRRCPQSFGLPLLAAATTAVLHTPSAHAATTPGFVMGGRWSRNVGRLPIPAPGSSVPTIVLDEDELFACVSPTRHTAHVLRRHRHRVWGQAAEAPAEACTDAEFEDAPTIAFPGGGVYFYWQSGAVHYLQKHFDLTKARLVGASAGALTAALAGCDVNMPLAAETALRMSMNIGLWERPLGLAGVWGNLVRRWLDDLLPHDAAEKCRHRVQLYVNLLERRAIRTSGLPLRHEKVSDFRDRADLIETAMGSVHIPLFMDGKPLKRLPGRGLVLDGSFRLPKSALEDAAGKTLVLDAYMDENLQRPSDGPTDFVTLISPNGIKEMMRTGYRYAKRLHEEGKLDILAPIARDRFGHDELVHEPRSSSAQPGVGGKGQTGIGTIYTGGSGTGGPFKANEEELEKAAAAVEGVMEAVVDGGMGAGDGGAGDGGGAGGLRARL